MTRISPRTPVRRFSSVVGLGAVAVLALAGTVPVTAQDDDASIVVTTEVLGSVVEQLAGDAAQVSVIMPNGANPHSYEPSARDAEKMLGADVLVSNGLDLEEALVSILETADSEGVAWFQAAEHVSLLDMEAGDEHDEDEHDEDDHEDESHDEADEHDSHDEHDHGAEDPHVWTDPIVMVDIVSALEPVLADAGIDASAGAEALITELESLDGEVSEIVAAVPQDLRKLVTGHESLGYFAARYGFELIGTVIPGLSTSGEPTAREMAQLIEDIKANDVAAVFAEVGTPQAVAQAVASDSGAELVPLSTSQLPESGSYQDLIRGIATTVTDALAP